MPRLRAQGMPKGDLECKAALAAAAEAKVVRATQLSDLAAIMRSQSYERGEVIPSSNDLMLIEEEAVLTVKDVQHPWRPPKPLLRLGFGSLYAYDTAAAHGLSLALCGADGGAPQVVATQRPVLLQGQGGRRSGGVSGGGGGGSGGGSGGGNGGGNRSVGGGGVVLRGGPCRVLWLDRKMTTAILGTHALRSVLRQAEAAVQLILASAERAVAAVAGHTPEVRPAWRSAPEMADRTRAERTRQQTESTRPTPQPVPKPTQVITHRHPPPLQQPLQQEQQQEQQQERQQERQQEEEEKKHASEAQPLAAPAMAPAAALPAEAAAPEAATAAGAAATAAPAPAPSSMSPCSPPAFRATLPSCEAAAFIHVPVQPSLPSTAAVAASIHSLGRGWHAGGFGGLRGRAYEVNGRTEGFIAGGATDGEGSRRRGGGRGRSSSSSPSRGGASPGGAREIGRIGVARPKGPPAPEPVNRQPIVCYDLCTTSAAWARASAEGAKEGSALIAQGGALLAEVERAAQPPTPPAPAPPPTTQQPTHVPVIDGSYDASSYRRPPPHSSPGVKSAQATTSTAAAAAVAPHHRAPPHLPSPRPPLTGVRSAT